MINCTYQTQIVKDEELWQCYLDKSYEFDVFQTWYFHSLDNRGSPLLFVYKDKDDFIAIPLIKREIQDTDLCDFTSVYGYSGPVASKKFSNIDEVTAKQFEATFKKWLKEEKAISVFSRLHPFFQQNTFLKTLGGIKSNGKTIYIDLSLPLEVQRANYHKRLFRQVKQLRSNGYQIREATKKQEIIEFAQMYNDNMTRLAASSSYYFSENYFINLLLKSRSNCKLILVYDGEVMMCGAIITFSKNIIRNYLSATSIAYVNKSPSKLLTDEISIIGRAMGLNYFHLGGGVGGREDSLYQFKTYFSPHFLEDFIWCYIADEEAYNLLTSKQKRRLKAISFPLYRSI